MSAAQAPRRGKVLVLGRDTRAFLAVVRSLGRRGLDVHVGWCDPESPAARSRYVGTSHDIPPPSLRHFAWRDRILEILDRERFDLVIPCNDPSILPLQLHRKDFAPFLGSLYLLDDHAFRIAFDKHESYELARSLGIPVPRRLRLSRMEDLAALPSSLPLPALVKPKASFTPDRLARKHHVRWARSPAELQAHVRALLPWGDVAVEERVGGHGAGVELLAHEGRVLASFQHVRVHEPPSGGGSSYRRSSGLDPELFGAAQRILQALRYTGVAMVEFKVDPERGSWAFIEINARFWGSLPLALAAGVDFPYYLYQMWVEGRRQFPQGYRTGVHCRNLVNDLDWLRKTWRVDRRDPAVAAVPWWRLPAELSGLLTLRDHCDTFVLDDPRPGFAEIVGVGRRAARLVKGALPRLILAWPRVRRRRAATARRALRSARQVLFVCRGNVCRSAFAHQLARRVFPPHVQVASCGYHPEPGRPSPAEAVDVAREMDVDLAAHRSQVLSLARLREADVVFVFDEDNYLTLRERHAWAMPRIHFLGVLGDQAGVMIRDPDGRSRADFRIAYETIRRCVTSAFTAAEAPTAPGRLRALLAAVRLVSPVPPTLPYMPADDVGALEQMLLALPDQRPLRIFEYGSGGSSIHFPRLLRDAGRTFTWFCLEHDPRWAEHVGRALARHGLHDVQLLLSPIPDVAPARLNRSRDRRRMLGAGRRLDYRAYTETPARIGGPYDLVLVDGRDRKRCLETAITLVRPGGVVAFHDAHRDYYRCALARHPEGTFRTPKLWVWQRAPTIPG